MDENDKIFKELEAHLETYLKEEKEELLKYAKKDKKYIAKDLSKRGIGWLSGKLGIDFYKIPSEQRKEYEERLIRVIQTITLRNIDSKTDEIKNMIENLRNDIKNVIEKETQRTITEAKPKKPLIFIPHPYPEAPNFTGREKEREMLTNWLTEDKEHPLLSMVAIGGMGKSALAWRWLQEEVIERGLELDGVVWW